MSRLYVGNIPNDCRESDIERFFRGYGRIREIVIKNCYGFVEFSNSRDADDAVHDLNGKKILGERVNIQFAKRDTKVERKRALMSSRHNDSYRSGNLRTKYRIRVDNISSKTHWKELKEYFRLAGEVAYANAHTPRTGEGVIEFENRKGMEYALKHKSDLKLDGRKLVISSEMKRSRSRTRSRSRSRSRDKSSSSSRSKSRSRSSSRTPPKKVKKSSVAVRSKSRTRSRTRSRSRSPRKSRSRK